MYGLPILPFWNILKNFTWSLRPSDSLPPVSPPFWRHIAKSDFLIFGNHISRDHISDLWTGISSVGSLNATFHCHCFTLFQCFSSFFSSPSQISWFFANRISQVTFLICCLAFLSLLLLIAGYNSALLTQFFSLLYLHLLISASPLIVQCACSLTFRWGFDGRRPVTRPICQGWIKISSNNELSPVLIRLLPQILVSGNWRRMLVSCCTGKGLGMRFNWDNYEHDRVATSTY